MVDGAGLEAIVASAVVVGEVPDDGDNGAEAVGGAVLLLDTARVVATAFAVDEPISVALDAASLGTATEVSSEVPCEDAGVTVVGRVVARGVVKSAAEVEANEAGVAVVVV